MRIYLSSTLEDLRDHRAQVMDALRKDGHVVIDSYEATAKPTLAQCVSDVKSTQVYVGLFAWRYGWVPDGEHKSITELEYEAAANLPRLVFLRPLKGWDAELVDADRTRIEQVRLQVGDGTAQTANLFTTPEDLALKVSRAVRRLEQEASEAPRRERAVARGETLMEPAPAPHPHRLSTGLLLLGVRGSDETSLHRLRAAMPEAWETDVHTFDLRPDADLPAIDALAARSRCAALLVTPATWPSLKTSPEMALLSDWLGTRLGGFHVLSVGVAAEAMPPDWLVQRVSPIGTWLAGQTDAIGGEMAALLQMLQASEPDLPDAELLGLATTTLAMTETEAQELAAEPAQIKHRLVPQAYEYFNSVTASMPSPWTARYGARRGDWRPFGGRSIDSMVAEAVNKLNRQVHYDRREFQALQGHRVRLRPYPFEPKRLTDAGSATALAYEAMRERGCLVLIDELSMLHPDLRPHGTPFASAANASVATLSPHDPSVKALDHVTSLNGPFDIGMLVDRFAGKLDPRCELSINSTARLRRWLKLAVPETLALTDASIARPERRAAMRQLAWGREYR